MYDSEEYNHFLEELKDTQDSEGCYCMHNRELAKEFFDEFKKTHYYAEMYCYDSAQFITENANDRQQLYKYLIKRKAHLLADVKEVEAVMMRVKADGIV